MRSVILVIRTKRQHLRLFRAQAPRSRRRFQASTSQLQPSRRSPLRPQLQLPRLHRLRSFGISMRPFAAQRGLSSFWVRYSLATGCAARPLSISSASSKKTVWMLKRFKCKTMECQRRHSLQRASTDFTQFRAIIFLGFPPPVQRPTHQVRRLVTLQGVFRATGRPPAYD